MLKLKPSLKGAHLAPVIVHIVRNKQVSTFEKVLWYGNCAQVKVTLKLIVILRYLMYLWYVREFDEEVPAKM